MVNHTKQGNIQISWQDLLWRLVVTALLLLFLASSGLTFFDSVVMQPNAQVLPANFAYDAESSGVR